MKPSKCPTKEKDQAEGKKAKKGGMEGKEKSKSQVPKFRFQHMIDLKEADIMQKAAKYTNCQPLFGEI